MKITLNIVSLFFAGLATSTTVGALSAADYPPLPSKLVHLESVFSDMPSPITTAEKQVLDTWMGRYVGIGCQHAKPSDDVMGWIASKNSAQDIKTFASTFDSMLDPKKDVYTVREDGGVTLISWGSKDKPTNMVLLVADLPARNQVFMASCGLKKLPVYRSSAKKPNYLK